MLWCIHSTYRHNCAHVNAECQTAICDKASIIFQDFSTLCKSWCTIPFAHSKDMGDVCIQKPGEACHQRIDNNQAVKIGITNTNCFRCVVVQPQLVTCWFLRWLSSAVKVKFELCGIPQTALQIEPPAFSVCFLCTQAELL